MDVGQPQNRKLFIPLIIFTSVCAIALIITNRFTNEKILQNKQELQYGVINTLMPLGHDNNLLEDVIEINNPEYLGNNENVLVFRTRNDGNPVGVVMMPIVARGYNGEIRIGIGLAQDGSIQSVRVLEHHETQGLGDGIDRDKSDWITRFNNLSLANTPLEAWAVKNEGGDFDQLSGATITSRAVINAVKKSLEFYEINNDSLYLK